MNDEVDTITPKSILWRVIISAVAFVLYWSVNMMLAPMMTLTVSDAAGRQLQSSDVEYTKSVYETLLSGYYQISPLVLIVVLALIWYGVGRKLVALMTVAMIAVIVTPNTAYAYYDRQDWPEIYYIQPDETCFYVPDVGDTANTEKDKDKQVKFMSMEYLNKSIVAAKRFKIPHTKLESSSYWKDYVVPAGRLHCVTRTPYARSWTANASTGTSKSNESFRCQSKDGVTASADLAITATITEENAYKYLYWFGVQKPDGNPTDPNVIFMSVFHARAMETVMDNFVSKQVLPIICAKFSDRTVDEINAQSSVIQKEAYAEASQFLLEKGVTLLGLGWGNIDYEDYVQQAINQEFAAKKISASLPTLQTQADIKLKTALAEALKEKGIPMPSNLVVVPDNLLKNIPALFQTNQK